MRKNNVKFDNIVNFATIFSLSEETRPKKTFPSIYFSLALVERYDNVVKNSVKEVFNFHEKERDNLHTRGGNPPGSSFYESPRKSRANVCATPKRDLEVHSSVRPDTLRGLIRVDRSGGRVSGG